MPIDLPLAYRGDWLSHRYYERGDVVAISSALYVCLHPRRSITAPDADTVHWALLEAAGGTAQGSYMEPITDAGGNLLVTEAGGVVMGPGS